MRLSAAILGAAVLLAGVGTAQAQVNLESQVTVALVRHTTTGTGTTNVVKTRVGTRDLVNMVNASNTTGTATGIQMQRAAVAAVTVPPTTFLNQALVFVDRTGATVAPAPVTVTQTPVVLADNLVNTSAVTRVNGSTTTTARVNTLEGNVWEFDATGATPAADLLTLDMIADEVIALRRNSSGGTDRGLWFGPRTATIRGGAELDPATGTTQESYLAGSIKASPERINQ